MTDPLSLMRQVWSRSNSAAKAAEPPSITIGRCRVGSRTNLFSRAVFSGESPDCEGRQKGLSVAVVCLYWDFLAVTELY
jgi:hypothetical protein